MGVFVLPAARAPKNWTRKPLGELYKIEDRGHEMHTSEQTHALFSRLDKHGCLHPVQSLFPCKVLNYAVVQPSCSATGKNGNVAWSTTLHLQVIVGNESHVYNYEAGGMSALGGVAFNVQPNLANGEIPLERLVKAVR